MKQEKLNVESSHLQPKVQENKPKRDQQRQPVNKMKSKAIGVVKKDQKKQLVSTNLVQSQGSKQSMTTRTTNVIQLQGLKETMTTNDNQPQGSKQAKTTNEIQSQGSKLPTIIAKAQAQLEIPKKKSKTIPIYRPSSLDDFFQKVEAY